VSPAGGPARTPFFDLTTENDQCINMVMGHDGENAAVLGCHESTARFYVFKALHRVRDIWRIKTEDACSAKQALCS
jgi:hypothetical protein